MSVPVNLGVEDPLSAAVLVRLLGWVRRDYVIGQVYSRGGFGYLKKTAPGWNRAAEGVPFVLLTDLDQNPCPPGLIDNWLEGSPRHPNLLFRVAVREVEPWLLADPGGLSRFLHISRKLVPAEPDSLPDPKRTLFGLATRSRQGTLRRRLLPRQNRTAQVGPEYNDGVFAQLDARRGATFEPSFGRPPVAD